MEVCTAQESQKRTTCAADSDLRLPFTDLSSQESSRPSIDDLVRTPPPWKSPYIIDSTSPKAALRLLVPDAVDFTSPELQLPLSVCESEYNCGSPTKTPGRVARVFGQLHPITPRKKSEKNFIRRGVHAMCRMGTVIGIKAPPRQFKSLADLRRLLLQRHRSLHKAFREMENHLQEFKQQEGTAWKKSKAISGNHSMDLLEFSRAIAFCGIDHYEAQHFFKLMDTNEDGFITIEEFKTSLVTMPRDVLLQDFRKRLLTKYATTFEAFKQLSQAPGHRDKSVEGDLSQPLTREMFAFRMLRLGVDEKESSLLFDIIDTDASGTISIWELRETLREVALPVSLEEFWHRFHSRWPNIRAEASSGSVGRRRAVEAVFKILPEKYRGTSLDLPLGLSSDAWNVLCEELDVSRTNGEELFRQCATAKIWQGHRAMLPGCLEEPRRNNECDFDDFFDELQLWSQTPRARQGPEMRQSYSKDVAQRLRSIKPQAVAA